MDAWVEEQLGVATYKASFQNVSREQLLAFDRRKLLSLGLAMQHANKLAFGECAQWRRCVCVFAENTTDQFSLVWQP